MKNIGIICEGESDAVIMNSSSFQHTLENLKLKCVRVIDVNGNGNLLPENMQEHIQTLQREKAEIILVVSDLDEDKCITETKARLTAGNFLPQGSFVLVVVKALESWFLADSTTLSVVFRKKYSFEKPQDIDGSPYERLKSEFKTHFGKGTGGSKVRFARWIVAQGFIIEKAANHEFCPSAKYFLSKLKEISTS
ncbi:MAG: hypothetical protein ABI729_09370 [Chitinophagales bacterium]